MTSFSAGERSCLSLVGVLVLVLAEAAFAQTTFVPFGADWAYLDDGSDQGSAWTTPGYDDSSWATGTAEFGYGESDQVTTVGFGPNATSKFITTYFRHVFDLPDPAALPGIKIELLRDDGAVVFVNGAEVARSNMPATGDITHTTRASSGLAGGTERVLDEIIVSPDLLVAGANLVAVEVHQESPGSSDMSFDARITDAVGPTPPKIRNCVLAVSGSDPVITVTSENLSATDFTSDEAALRFRVSGLESGRFELAGDPGVAISEFTQAQIGGGAIRFVYEPGRFGAGESAGVLENPSLHNEISGLVASILNPDLLWAHEDSDNPATLIALGTDGRSRGEWALAGAANSDWEDIGAALVGEQAMLYIGDFGDNDAARTDVRILRVQEPLLANDAGGTIPATDIETIQFQYPESPPGERGTGSPGVPARRDAESLIVDPHSGDMYILSKRETTGRLFRLAHQASYAGVQTLEYLGEMPAIIHDQVQGFSASSTAADISRDGLEILVRNYGHVMCFRRPDLDTTIADLLTGDSIEELPFVGFDAPGGEPVGESICFSPSANSFFTIGETSGGSPPIPLFRYRRLPPNSPPAFSISVSDGVLSDGPHPATILFNAGSRELWQHEHFTAGELDDPGLESSIWGFRADPDGDRLPNLVEYALGGDPRSPQDDEIVVVEPAGGSLTLIYRRDLAHTGVQLRAQVSSDLRNWTDLADELVGSANGIETRRAILGGGARRYLRLAASIVP